MNVEDYITKAEKALKKTIFSKPNPKQAVCYYLEASSMLMKQNNAKMALEILQRAQQLHVDDFQVQMIVQMDILRAKEVLNATTAGDYISAAQACQLAGGCEKAAQLYFMAASETHDHNKAHDLIREAEDVLGSNGGKQSINIYLLDTVERVAASRRYSNAIQLVELAKDFYTRQNNQGRKLDKVLLWGCLMAAASGDMVKCNELKEYFSDTESYYYLFADQVIQGFEQGDADLIREAMQRYAPKTQQPPELLEDLRAAEAGGLGL